MRLSALYAIGFFLVSSAQAACQLSDDGNYYCSSTNKVVYAGVGFDGTYDEITSMDADTKSCSSKTKSFSGNLSPLDEDLSLHFRGPLKLKQFGVYYPASSSSKKAKKAKKVKRDEDCDTTLVHKHHQHKRATQIVEVTQTVYVDGNGVTQTQEKLATSTQGTDKIDTTVSTSAAVTSSSSSSAAAATSSAAADDDSDDEDDEEAADGDWERSAYYTPGQADGLVFLNHYGGDGSGVFDYAFGNSISYANSDCSGGASSPTVLDDVTIGSNTEYMIMSDKKCSGDDCGFYREGIPAYHGFKGSQKIFVFEFQMPEASGSKTAINYDMPAIWALNAKIPRTLQYGVSECSCWPACGELDLFEVLSAGSGKMITHLHDKQGGAGGGSQDFFDRPYDSTMKAAVVFDGSDINIVKVDDDTDFDSVLSKSTVSKWVNSSNSGSKVTIG